MIKKRATLNTIFLQYALKSNATVKIKSVGLDTH